MQVDGNNKKTIRRKNQFLEAECDKCEGNKVLMSQWIQMNPNGSQWIRIQMELNRSKWIQINHNRSP